MRIEQITIKNYKALRDVTIKDIPMMSVFLGVNGAGKTTLFDVFGFLHDALRDNVYTALAKRGGYKQVISRGESGAIEFEIKFRSAIKGIKSPLLVTYQLEIREIEGSPVVSREILKYRRGQKGKPWHFLDFSNGKGTAIINEDEYGVEDTTEEREEQTLGRPDILAIKGLGQFEKFKAANEFRKLLENWYVSNLKIDAARNTNDVGVATHLSTSGENLALYAKYLYDHHRNTFDDVLKKMRKRVPGIEKVEAKETEDGKFLLRFQDGAFEDPFIARFVSDGTIKMFSYLLLLNDPEKFPLLCIEEPENFLHPSLLVELADEFREYAEKGGQVFISTHSPDFVNALNLEELFWLEKEHGFSKIRRAKDIPEVAALYNEGDKLGYLWNQKYLKGSYPA